MLQEGKTETKGEILKHLMRIKKINAKELAARLECSEQNIYKYYLKDSFESNTLEKIAEILEVSILEFFPKFKTETFTSSIELPKPNLNVNEKDKIISKQQSKIIELQERIIKLQDKLLKEQ